MTMFEQIRELTERCKARQEDPEFKRHAADNEADTQASLARSRDAERKIGLLSSGVPLRFWDDLKAPKKTPALAQVVTFLKAPPTCTFLTLAGPKGRGKSFAAAWAVAEQGGLYIGSAQDLVVAGSYAPIWADAAAARVLVVDEIGTEYRNDAYVSSLYSLLNDRFLGQRKTILASNLDANGLRRRLVEAGLERLLERLVTGGMFVALPGESMRTHWSEVDRDEGAVDRG